MTEALSAPTDEILAVKFTHELTEQELKELKPIFDKHLAQHDRATLFIKIEDFEGWEDAQTFISDLTYQFEYVGEFEQIAIVGDRKWEGWVTKLFDLFTEGDIEFFETDEEEQAWMWISTQHEPATS